MSSSIDHHTAHPENGASAMAEVPDEKYNYTSLSIDQPDEVKQIIWDTMHEDDRAEIYAIEAWCATRRQQVSQSNTSNTHTPRTVETKTKTDTFQITQMSSNEERFIMQDIDHEVSIDDAEHVLDRWVQDMNDVCG